MDQILGRWAGYYARYPAQAKDDMFDNKKDLEEEKKDIDIMDN